MNCPQGFSRVVKCSNYICYLATRALFALHRESFLFFFCLFLFFCCCCCFFFFFFPGLFFFSFFFPGVRGKKRGWREAAVFSFPVSDLQSMKGGFVGQSYSCVWPFMDGERLLDLFPKLSCLGQFWYAPLPPLTIDPNMDAVLELTWLSKADCRYVYPRVLPFQA